MTTTGKQLFTTLTADGKLTLEVAESQFPAPTGNQVLVKMEAAPINPSDLAILTSAADFETAEYTPGKVVATMPEPFLTGNKARHGQRLPAGNEGAHAGTGQHHRTPGGVDPRLQARDACAHVAHRRHHGVQVAVIGNLAAPAEQVAGLRQGHGLGGVGAAVQAVRDDDVSAHGGSGMGRFGREAAAGEW